MKLRQTIDWKPFSDKHKAYIKKALSCRMNVAEGAIRSGKTIDNCIIAAAFLEQCPDRIHLASGSSMANAMLNIGVCNGFGLENLFRGRCKWGKFRSNDALFIETKTGQKVVIFAGGGKADSYKHILGNSYGLWIATEINEHYDCDDSRSSFIKVAFGRQAAADRPMVLWDMNPCSPRHRIYTDYVDKYKKDFVGGYQHRHFTIDDNLSISERRKEEIKSQYDEGSIWYRRDILGQRCAAEGLVYPLFAENTSRFLADEINPQDISFANIGVDFGGDGSAHAFVCTGFSRDMTRVVTLDEFYLKEKISPAKLEEHFVAFVQKCKRSYRVFEAFPDSAETTLIQGLESAALRERLAIDIVPAAKRRIIDRIRFYNLLMSHDRYRISAGCKHTIEALCSAVWDPRKAEDVRLDNGSVNIDSLDALEYSTEKYMTEIIGLGVKN